MTFYSNDRFVIYKQERDLYILEMVKCVKTWQFSQIYAYIEHKF